MMKKGVLAVLFLLFIACTPLIAAVKNSEVVIEHENVKTSIQPGEVAQYKLEVTNNQAFDDFFYLSLDDVRFSPTLDPITDFTGGIKVATKGTKQSQLYVVPNPTLKVGEYHVRVDLTSGKTYQVFSDILTVYVAPTPEEYLAPNVTLRMAVQERIDPREDIRVMLSASNNNKLDLGEVLVSVKSGLFYREQTMKLGPHGSDSVSFTIKLDPFEPPRKDFVVATASRANMILALDRADVEVIEYSPPFVKHYQETSRFLRTVSDLTLENIGNVERQESIKVEMPWYRRIFSKSVPGHDAVQEGKQVFWVFDISLDSRETATFTLYTSYLLPFILFALLVVGLALYFLVRAPVIVYKRAKIIERTEGGISKLKVYLHVKNRSAGTYENIRIIEKISSIARLIREKQMGTLAPVKIASKGSFTFVEWRIPKLEAGEERVIHYKLESRLSILGDFKLKRSMVEYGTDKVRSQAFSNEFFVDVDGKEVQIPSTVALPQKKV